MRIRIRLIVYWVVYKSILVSWDSLLEIMEDLLTCRCGHCKNLAPHWAAAATELKGKVKLGALDATVHKAVASRYQVCWIFQHTQTNALSFQIRSWFFSLSLTSLSTSSQKVRKCGGHKLFLSQAIECGQVVSSSLLDPILVNFYHCFSGVAQVCRDAAGKWCCFHYTLTS